MKNFFSQSWKELNIILIRLPTFLLHLLRRLKRFSKNSMVSNYIFWKFSCLHPLLCIVEQSLEMEKSPIVNLPLSMEKCEVNLFFKIVILSQNIFFLQFEKLPYFNSNRIVEVGRFECWQVRFYTETSFEIICFFSEIIMDEFVAALHANKEAQDKYVYTEDGAAVNQNRFFYLLSWTTKASVGFRCGYFFCIITCPVRLSPRTLWKYFK